MQFIGMGAQRSLDYYRVAEAIRYIKQNFKSQPDLSDVANKVQLSPSHLQRIFTRWAGVSPKKFLQYISVEYAKNILRENKITLFDLAYEAGLSGTGRLHDLFVKIEGMTPGEFKNGGANLSIDYSLAPSPFGMLLIGTTDKGVCHMAFVENEKEGFAELQHRFPNAHYNHFRTELHLEALSIFSGGWSEPEKLKVHVKGTPFQLKVWETLMRIPVGQLTTYGNIATCIGSSGASRAVGTAIGENPVAFLIPCHRVIRATGVIGEYRWSGVRKTAMIGWEAGRS